jgi:phage gpG-like protein
MALGGYTWDDRRARSLVLRHIGRGMDRATIHLVGAIKRRLNRSNRRGLTPSLPGEPPRKVTGRLQRSISKDVIYYIDRVVGRVGSNLRYAAPLEYGFAGVDRGGRRRTLLPRPYLASTLERERDRVMRLIIRG